MNSNDHLALIDRYIYDNIDRFIEILGKLCAIPSITTNTEQSEGCARLVASLFNEQEIEAKIVSTEGNPIVIGESNDAESKTLLFYLHYDVQPPEPIDLWESPPFELTRRDNKLFARGAADDKGHIVARLAAIAAVQDALGKLPCKVKIVVEGEEESGSPNLQAFVQRYKEELSADACVWEFGGVNHEDVPIQALGMRGICYVELVSKTANRDAHSGLAGSLFPNSAWRLVWALKSLKGEDERILIPGFYDDVRPLTDTDLSMLHKLPDESIRLRELYGLDNFLKDMRGGLAFKKAAVFEPTCTICGLEAGHQGPGSKTVLPAQATAKVDFRLVPDQDPQDVLAKLRSYLDFQGFKDIKINFLGGTRPARTDPEDPFVQLANSTAVAVYGKNPLIRPMIGGSGPNHLFINDLNLPVVSAGVGYPDNRGHAPNEHIRIHDLVQGIRHTAYIIEAFGRN